MDIRLSQGFIAVDDHDKARAFHRDVLGLEVRNDVGCEGMRWVTVGSPSQPDVEIVPDADGRCDITALNEWGAVGPPACGDVDQHRAARSHAMTHSPAPGARRR